MIMALIASEYSLLGITILISIVALEEYFNIAKSLEIKPQKAMGHVLSLLTIVLTFLIIKKIVLLESLLLLIPAIFMVLILQLFHKHKKPLESVALTIFPLIHITIPLTLMIILGTIGEEYDYQLNLGILFMIWANDTFAYIMGVTMGKTPLFPRVSPKKSWEGFISGLVASITVSQIIAHHWTIIPSTNWAILSVITVLGAVFGDLVESLYKREAMIKDSGTLLPGHGGVLDRFDSLFMVMPFSFVYLYFTLISN